ALAGAEAQARREARRVDPPAGPRPRLLAPPSEDRRLLPYRPDHRAAPRRPRDAHRADAAGDGEARPPLPPRRRDAAGPEDRPERLEGDPRRRQAAAGPAA